MTGDTPKIYPFGPYQIIDQDGNGKYESGKDTITKRGNYSAIAIPKEIDWNKIKNLNPKSLSSYSAKAAASYLAELTIPKNYDAFMLFFSDSKDYYGKSGQKNFQQSDDFKSIQTYFPTAIATLFDHQCSEKNKSDEVDSRICNYSRATSFDEIQPLLDQTATIQDLLEFGLKEGFVTNTYSERFNQQAALLQRLALDAVIQNRMHFAEKIKTECHPTEEDICYANESLKEIEKVISFAVRKRIYLTASIPYINKNFRPPLQLTPQCK